MDKAMSFRVAFVGAFKGELEKAFRELNKPIAEAATAAMKEASEIAKAEGRASIAAAGFSKRWQNALRVDVYPERGKPSINPAFVIRHNIPYAGVFEDGAEIWGKPKLWLPLPTLKVKRVSRQKVTPKLVSTLLPDKEKLQTLKRPGKQPLLAVKLRLSKAKADAPNQSITAADIRKGQGSEDQKKKRDGKTRIVSVPIFVALDMVTIRPRFGIRKIMQGVRDRLAALYLKNFRGD
jgi:hypothetical protein